MVKVMVKVKDFFRNIFLIHKQKKANFDYIKELFEHDEFEELKQLVNSHKARFSFDDFETTPGFLEKSKYLSLECNVVDETIKARVFEFNKKIITLSKTEIFEGFSINAEEKILSLIDSNMPALSPVKYSGFAQLFSKKRIHILVMADYEIKTDFLIKDLSAISPNSIYTHGKGSKEAGLTIAFKEGNLIKGSLAKADKGTIFIKDLNLLQTIDRAGLIGAMNKGIIEYHKKSGKDVEVNADVKVFSTAHPEGEAFIGNSISVLKKQVPFDSEVYVNFQIVFMIRKKDFNSSDKTSENKTKNNNDQKFVREYVTYALTKEVEFNKDFSGMIQGYVNDVARDKNKFLFKLGNSSVITIIEFSKAFARARLKEIVEKEDVLKALRIMNSALYMENDFKK